MVLTNAVMEGETERHDNAGEELLIPFLVPKKEYFSQSRWRCIQTANDIFKEAPDLGILVDEGYVSDDSVGEDGSEQDYVVNELFAEHENWERSVESVVVTTRHPRGF